MPSLTTTHGPIDESRLACTVGFEHRPTEYVVWIEWRLSDHDGRDCAICANHDNPQPVNGSTLVRRDAHVILKESSVVAGALAATF